MTVLKVIVFVFGVILPAAALTVELLTGICASAFINPIPTPLHTLLVAFVPISNLFVLWRTSKKDYKPAMIDFLACATAIGISGIYSFYFAPIALFSVVFGWMAGVGLLPLAPLTSCIASAYYLRRIYQLQKASGRPFKLGSLGMAACFCMGFCCLAGIICSSLVFKTNF